MRGLGAFQLTPGYSRCSGEAPNGVTGQDGKTWCYTDQELAALQSAGAGGGTVRNATGFEQFTHSLTEIPWWIYVGVAGGAWWLLRSKH